MKNGFWPQSTGAAKRSAAHAATRSIARVVREFRLCGEPDAGGIWRTGAQLQQTEQWMVCPVTGEFISTVTGLSFRKHLSVMRGMRKKGSLRLQTTCLPRAWVADSLGRLAQSSAWRVPRDFVQLDIHLQPSPQPVRCLRGYVSPQWDINEWPHSDSWMSAVVEDVRFQPSWAKREGVRHVWS